MSMLLNTHHLTAEIGAKRTSAPRMHVQWYNDAICARQ